MVESECLLRHSVTFPLAASCERRARLITARGHAAMVGRTTSNPLAQKSPTSKTVSDDDACVLHVHGVKSGPGSTQELTRIFQAFGAVESVVVRDRVDPELGDTSWALVTMISAAVAESVISSGVTERMDPSQQITVALYNQDVARSSAGVMGVRFREQSRTKVLEAVKNAEHLAANLKRKAEEKTARLETAFKRFWMSTQDELDLLESRHGACSRRHITLAQVLAYNSGSRGWQVSFRGSTEPSRLC